MRGQQTYSLTTILNTNQIQPQIYQQILQDIKSPLEQVSIDLTNDNSLIIDRTPRRPNIPPPPPKSPLNNLGNFNFSRTHESYSLSIKESPEKRKQIFHDEVIESVLSPLDQQISFKQQPKSQVPFCGGLMESILRSENSFQIQLPPRTKFSKRRPIFEGSRLTKSIKTSKPIQEVIRILYEVGEMQMALFFQLLRDLERELAKISQEKEQIKGYLDLIYEKLSENIELLNSEGEESPSNYRILRRMQSKNTYELISKMVKQTSPERSAEANRKLEKLLSSLNNLEAIISKFMREKEAIDTLGLVYEYLQENYPTQRTLLTQLQKLCDCFNCSLSLRGFQLIWRESDKQQLTRDQFIEGITMNDYIVRLPKSFQKQLEGKGFTRNQ